MNALHQKSGFTIIEMVMTMGISAVIMSALIFFFSGSLASYRSQIANIFATTSARNQVQRITDVLRSAQDNPSTSEKWLMEANNDSLTIWTDINGDLTLEKVQYARPSGAPTTLTRCVTTGDACDSSTTKTIAQSIANATDNSESVFTYYDALGNSITDTADRTAQNVRSIGVRIVNTSNNPQDTNPQGISTRITPRQNLQGTISDIIQPNNNREVAIELPRGYPPSGADVNVVITNPGSGATISSTTVPITDLNDGRISTYQHNYPAIINYKNNTVLGNSAGWYAFLNQSVPSLSNLYPILVSTLYTNQCLGEPLVVTWTTVQTSCAQLPTSWYPISSTDTYRPILTYTVGLNRDFVRGIYVKPPVLTSFTSTPVIGKFKVGGSVIIEANYDENVLAGSTITVLLDTGKSVTLSTVSNTRISGTYTVGVGENSPDLNVLSISSQSVTDTYTPSSTRTDKVLPTSNLSSNSAIVIDTTAPTVTGVTSSPVSGSYNVPDVISIRVAFSEAVNVVGTPQLILSVGSNYNINCASGSGITTLTCTYTVAAGHTSADLSYVNTSSLILPSAAITIKDLAGNNAIRTLASPGALNSLSANSGLVIDTTAPTVNITSTSSNPTKTSPIPITITFTDASTLINGFAQGDVVTTNVNSGWILNGSGKVYTANLVPTSQGTVTVNIAAGVASDPAGNTNTAAAFTRTYDSIAPAPPTANPAGATYSSSQNVTLSAEAGAAIRYTTDGTTPTVSSTLYSSAIAISSSTTLKAIAIDVAGNISLVMTEPYTINLDTTPPAPPTATPPGGTYASAQNVTLSLAVGEPVSTSIYYCTGSACDPTVSGTFYSSAISIASSTTLKAIAIDLAGNVSTVMSQVYTIDTVAPTIVTFSPVDNAIGVSRTSNLVMTFSETVTSVTAKNLLIKRMSDNVTIETVAVTGALVSGSGTSTITVNPASVLASSTSYYILIDSGAFKDAANNNYAGITSTTAWNFTVRWYAIDLIGQYVNETDSPLQPDYSKSIKNDGQLNTNRFGLSDTLDVLLDTVDHYVFIADKENKRVLIYNLNTNNTFPDKIPDYVLGQPDFTSNTSALTQNKICQPEALAYDNNLNRLFVADWSCNRVLVYNITTITNGENAVNVLGQPNFTVSILNVTQGGLEHPRDLAYDSSSSRLFVADQSNSRVLVYDVASITNGENAINVLGQSDFNSKVDAVTQNGMHDPHGLAYDSSSSRLFVADAFNSRVLVYDVASITNGENAINVLGQSDFTSSSFVTTQNGMSTPHGLAYDSSSSRLFVADQPNNRVLVYDVASITNGENAINVLGQSDFTSSSPATTQDGNRGPDGIMYDSTNSLLYVADPYNNRVMIFSTP